MRNPEVLSSPQLSVATKVATCTWYYNYPVISAHFSPRWAGTIHKQIKYALIDHCIDNYTDLASQTLLLAQAATLTRALPAA